MIEILSHTTYRSVPKAAKSAALQDAGAPSTGAGSSSQCMCQPETGLWGFRRFWSAPAVRRFWGA